MNVKTGKYRSEIIVLSLCLGAVVSMPLQASRIDHHEYQQQQKAPKACCSVNDEVPEDWFNNGLHKGFDKGFHKGPKHGKVVDLDAFPGRGESQNHWFEGKINWHDRLGRSNRDHLEPINNGNHYGLGKHCIIEEPAAVVPVPAAAWLLGSGLIGLVGFARRRSN